MLILDDISVRIAGRLLIEHASVSLQDGVKTGLVGHNGTGKSTLFRVITDDLAPETGKVELPRNIRIGQVAQEAPGTDEPLVDIVLAANKELAALLQAAETETDPYRIAEIHTRLADIDAYSAEARASSILGGLGFDRAAQLRPASSFSGGWRMRVALAAVLFSQPDILMLDEPTNYLDLEGTLWLIDYVRNYPHTVIIISHDRDLLNSAVTSILHLENQKLTFWRGNYDAFEQRRAETILLQQKQAVKQDARRKHMEAFVNRFRAKATKARQAQSRLKLLEKMQTVAVWQDEHVQPISFPEAKKQAASPIIAASGVSVGYETGKPILKNLELRIDHDDRIALLGANGNGKSTFAKLLAGRLEPETGIITRSPDLKVAFFAQHQLDDLFPEETPVEHVRRLLPQEPEARLRARVAQMGLATAKMTTKAKDLSGGEKARLLLGLATLHGPNLLILDEPTNHLDIDSRAALIDALNAFNGAVILIAHDRHLIEATADQLWKVGDGGVTPYSGTMEDYRNDVLALSRQAGKRAETQPPSQSSDSGKAGSAKQAMATTDKRAAAAALRKKIKQNEDMQEKLKQELQALDATLADPAIYQKNPEKAAQKAKSRGESARKLEAMEGNWLALQEELEQLA